MAFPKRQPKPPQPVEPIPVEAAPVGPPVAKRPNQAPRRRPRMGKNKRNLPPV